MDDKIVAILGGGDWADASVEHVAVPNNMDIMQMYDQYREDIYNEKWVSFREWLMQHGAREITDDDKLYVLWEMP